MMYYDIILLAGGGLFALIVIVSAAYLIHSNKRSHGYRELLRSETETFEAISSTTAFMTGNMTHSTTTGVIRNDSDSTDSVCIDMDKTTDTVALDDSTVVLDDGSENQDLNKEKDQLYSEMNYSVLEGKYIIESELAGGGMGRVFRARNAKLGNPWVVKFVPKTYGALANEENILKLLNHISLPKIVDIFKDDSGVFIVESLIEGVTLNKVTQAGIEINQAVVLEWAEQLAQSLNYLHSIEPSPVCHLDIKPSNIMVTHDNRLVLIDFGISRVIGVDNDHSQAITYKYAAPEQIKGAIPEKYVEMIEMRFGNTAAGLYAGIPDHRTDIYSLGVVLFELITGQIPTTDNLSLLEQKVSTELRSIIVKCLQVVPDDRYQASEVLLSDITAAKTSKTRMIQTLFMRKLAAAAFAVSLVLSIAGFGTGAYAYAIENAATINLNPKIIVVSIHQSTELIISKLYKNGKVTDIENSGIRWQLDAESIARIDGNRVIGINLGQSDIKGEYRNKNITVDVKVVEPMNGLVDISQRYESGHSVIPYTGSLARAAIDGTLNTAEFVSPESIAVSDSGDIYVIDSGNLRKISGDEVRTIPLEPTFLRGKSVRTRAGELYILTDTWSDNNTMYYGIIKLSEDNGELIYRAEAEWTQVSDFDIAPDGTMWLIEENYATGKSNLVSITDDGVLTKRTELESGATSVAVGDNNTVFYCNAQLGIIQVYADGELKNFSGISGERAFIDGAAPLYYAPQRVKYYNGRLFIFDFNVLRSLSTITGEAITLAGEANPEFELEPTLKEYRANDIILPNSALSDILVYEDYVLITDPKRGMIWKYE